MQWLALYRGGDTLPQCNEAGEIQNTYSDIDRERLAAFVIHEGERVVLVVHFERPTQRLVYRRRHQRMHNPLTGERTAQMFIIVGWHETINGHNFKAINYVYEDGHIELGGPGPYDDVEYVPCEEDMV